MKKNFLLAMVAFLALSLLAGCGSKGSAGITPVTQSTTAGKKAFRFNVRTMVHADAAHILGGSTNVTLGSLMDKAARETSSVGVTPYDADGNILPSGSFPVDPEGWVTPEMNLPEGQFSFQLNCVDANGRERLNGYLDALTLSAANTSANPATVNVLLELDEISVGIVINAMPGTYTKSTNQGTDGNVYAVEKTGGYDGHADDFAAYVDQAGSLHFHENFLVQLNSSTASFYMAVTDDKGVYYSQRLNVNAQALLNAAFYGTEIQFGYVPGGTLTMSPTY